MSFFKCLANDWADITDLSSSGSEFHKQLPLNVMDLSSVVSCFFEHRPMIFNLA